jgi:hypothetical protein
MAVVLDTATTLDSNVNNDPMDRYWDRAPSIYEKVDRFYKSFYFQNFGADSAFSAAWPNIARIERTFPIENLYTSTKWRAIVKFHMRFQTSNAYPIRFLLALCPLPSGFTMASPLLLHDETTASASSADLRQIDVGYPQYTDFLGATAQYTGSLRVVPLQLTNQILNPQDSTSLLSTMIFDETVVYEFDISGFQDKSGALPTVPTLDYFYVSLIAITEVLAGVIWADSVCEFIPLN